MVYFVSVLTTWITPIQQWKIFERFIFQHFNTFTSTRLRLWCLSDRPKLSNLVLLHCHRQNHSAKIFQTSFLYSSADPQKAQSLPSFPHSDSPHRSPHKTNNFLCMLWMEKKHSARTDGLFLKCKLLYNSSSLNIRQNIQISDGFPTLHLRRIPHLPLPPWRHILPIPSWTDSMRLRISPDTCSLLQIPRPRRPVVVITQRPTACIPVMLPELWRPTRGITGKASFSDEIPSRRNKTLQVIQKKRNLLQLKEKPWKIYSRAKKLHFFLTFPKGSTTAPLGNSREER